MYNICFLKFNVEQTYYFGGLLKTARVWSFGGEIVCFHETNSLKHPMLFYTNTENITKIIYYSLLALVHTKISHKTLLIITIKC